MHTVGGVVAPGEQMMLIVPSVDVLNVEAKIQPQDVDQVYVGQTAILRFSSFRQRTTPELNGLVQQISADLSEDQKTGTRYYTLRMSVPDNELRRLGNLKPIPGMPVEAFVKTTPRTVFTFLTKSLRDQVALAFREK